MHVMFLRGGVGESKAGCRIKDQQVGVQRVIRVQICLLFTIRKPRKKKEEKHVCSVFGTIRRGAEDPCLVSADFLNSHFLGPLSFPERPHTSTSTVNLSLANESGFLDSAPEIKEG